jgi:excisionase family DNA binding protein
MKTQETPTELPCNERLVTAREISRVLGVGASTLYVMAKKNRVPHYKIGETGIRYRMSEVLAALRRPARTDAVGQHDAR